METTILFSLVCVASLPLSHALRGRSLQGPLRVKIPEFTIRLMPASYDLNALGALQVRDIAETLFEASLEGHSWGSSTFYDYAGILGIEHVSVDNSTIPEASVIKIRGAMVVFSDASTSLPSVDELSTILDESINKDNALTFSLQSASDFSFVESATYGLFSLDSASPSERPSLAPSSTPSLEKRISSAENDLATIGGNGNSSSSFGVIGGAVAGLAAVASVIGLFLLRRRTGKAEQWKAGKPHIYPADTEDSSGLHKKDSLQGLGVSDVKSETGSSIFGRLLAAAAPPPRPLLNNSPDTTPHCSSDSQGSSPEAFQADATVMLPSILKLHSLESFEVDRHMSTTLQKQMMEPGGFCLPADWQKDSHVQPLQCALTPADLSSAIYFDKWSDCSSKDDVVDMPAEGSDTDNEGNFAPDEAWDFQDNDEDFSEVTMDPFYTTTSRAHDNSISARLLSKFVERSTMACANTCNKC